MQKMSLEQVRIMLYIKYHINKVLIKILKFKKFVNVYL